MDEALHTEDADLQDAGGTSWLYDRRMWLYALGLIVIVLFIGLYLSNRTASNQLQPIFADYVSVRSQIASGVTDAKNKLETNQEEVSKEWSTIEPIIGRVAHARGDGVEAVARAVSSFLEIGKTKTLSDAVQRTEQDLEYIHAARDRIDEVQYDPIPAEETSVSDDVEDNIRDFYDKLNEFLIELLKYKRYNKDVLAAIPVQDLEDNTERMLDLQNELLESESLSEREKFIPQFREVFSARRDIAQRALDNLSDVSPPTQFAEANRIDFLHDMYTQKFDILRRSSQHNLSRIKREGASYLTNPNRKFEGLKAQNTASIERVLHNLSTNSALSQRFDSVLQQDKTIRQATQDHPELRNLLANQPGLEELVQSYERSANNEFQQRIEKLEEKARNLADANPVIQKTDFRVPASGTNVEAEVTVGQHRERQVTLDDLSMYIKTPKGERFKLGKGPTETRVRSATAASFPITEYISGPEQWSVIVEGPHYATINVKVLGDFPWSMNSQFRDSADTEPGDPVVMETSIEYTNGELEDLDVWANVTNGLAQTDWGQVNLLDNGDEFDATADDNVFTGTITETPTEDTFCATFVATGTNPRGKTVRMEDGQRCAVVGSGAGYDSKPVEEGGRDND